MHDVQSPALSSITSRLRPWALSLLLTTFDFEQTEVLETQSSECYVWLKPSGALKFFSMFSYYLWLWPYLDNSIFRSQIRTKFDHCHQMCLSQTLQKLCYLLPST